MMQRVSELVVFLQAILNVSLAERLAPAATMHMRLREG
jgi:hypothetical protein